MRQCQGKKKGRKLKLIKQQFIVCLNSHKWEYFISMQTLKLFAKSFSHSIGEINKEGTWMPL